MSATGDDKSASAPAGEQGQAAGSPSDSTEPTSGDPDVVSKDQFDAARRKITEQADKIKAYDAVYGVMQDDPDLTLRGAMQMAQTGEKPVPQEFEQRRKEVLEKFDPETQKAIEALDSLNREEMTATFEAKFGPEMARLQRSTAETVEDRTVRQAGLNPHAPEFQSFRDEMLSNPIYATLKRGDAVHAASYLAQQFQQRQGAASASGNGKVGEQRAQDARDASLESRGSRGAASASPDATFEIDPKNTDIMEVYRATQAGKTPVVKT